MESQENNILKDRYSRACGIGMRNVPLKALVGHNRKQEY